ncbi:MAG: PQQ-binding-like beta-propeller repeat protein, partial [Syntrophales bacterium]|nr:PQQ-binding-like beta-propeller repeat protein [Syntrophales bacterium]
MIKTSCFITIVTLLSLFVLLSLAIPLSSNPADASLAAGAWPMLGHDAQHTGRSVFRGPQTDTIKWSRGITAFFSPVIGNDAFVYMGGTNINAVNTTGSHSTKYIMDNCWTTTPAMGTDGTIYAATYKPDMAFDGKLYAINANGTLKWIYDIGCPVLPAPTIDNNGVIYIGDEKGEVFAINPDGSKKWCFMPHPESYYQFTFPVRTSPAIGYDGTIYVTSQDYKLYALTPAGIVKWSFTTGDIASSPSIGGDGTIYISSADEHLYAVNPKGIQKWACHTSGWNAFPPAIGSDGSVYLGTSGGWLYAFSAGGSPKWSYRTGPVIDSSPAIGGDGTIYIGSEDGRIYAIDPSGNLKWSCAMEASIYCSPAIGSDGTLYIRGAQLYAFGVRSPYINATTPTTATIGSPYLLTPSVSSGESPYKWSSSGKPSWLALDSNNGVLSGTPGSTAKTVTFSLQVQDKNGLKASKDLTINIPASLPVINADTPTTANIGVHYASTPSVSGGTSPYIWSSNGKPSWLALNNTTGALSGTPDPCSKTTTFTLKVQDKNGNTASKDLTIIIPLSTPMINLGTVNPATIGKYYIITPNVLGGTEPYVWSAQGKPYWLALDTNGYLSGTPDNNAKTVTFTLQVQDKCGSRDSKSVTVNVSQDPNTLTDDELIARAKQRAQGQPAIGNLSCLEYCQRYGIGLCAVANGSTGSCKLGAYNILYQNNDAATGTRKSGVFLLQGIDDLTTVLHGNYERPGSGDFIVWMPNAAGADSQCGHIAYVELVEAHRVVIRQANVYTVDQSGNR